MNNFDSNTHFPNPFADVLMNQQILHIVIKMGVHTPTQKEQFVRDWHQNSKLSVEREYHNIMFTSNVSNFGTANPSRNEQRTAAYKSIQKEGKHYLEQRLTALDSFQKLLIDMARLCDTWMRLLPQDQGVRAYLEWVKNTPLGITLNSAGTPRHNIEEDVEAITNSVALVNVRNR
jgi:hypothetical protein